MKDGNFAVAQSGGPTAAINATLCGVIECAFSFGKNIYGAKNGILGVVNDNFDHLNPRFADMNNLQLLKNTPSAYLGSCRYKLPAPDEKSEVYETIFDNFKKHDIVWCSLHYLVDVVLTFRTITNY